MDAANTSGQLVPIKCGKRPNTPRLSRVLFYGPPITGETNLWDRLTNNDQACFALTLHAASSYADLIGFFAPKEDKFAFQEGPVVRAMRAGGLLILNAIDQATGAALTTLRQILDDPESVSLCLPTGEVLCPEPGFAIVATIHRTQNEPPSVLQDCFDLTLSTQPQNPNALRSLYTTNHVAILEDTTKFRPSAVETLTSISTNK